MSKQKDGDVTTCLPGLEDGCIPLAVVEDDGGTADTALASEGRAASIRDSEMARAISSSSRRSRSSRARSSSADSDRARASWWGERKGARVKGWLKYGVKSEKDISGERRCTSRECESVWNAAYSLRVRIEVVEDRLRGEHANTRTPI